MDNSNELTITGPNPIVGDAEEEKLAKALEPINNKVKLQKGLESHLKQKKRKSEKISRKIGRIQCLADKSSRRKIRR